MGEKPPVVLVVDDEAHFLEIFSVKLRAAGLEVETASSGKEGIVKAKSLHPDLILMDVKMPEIDGVQAFLKIKADPGTESVPVLFLTNLGDPRQELKEINARMSKEMGAIGYVKKTDDLDYVVERVKGVLGY